MAMNTADSNFKKGAWTEEEHTLFMECLKTHGKNYKKLQDAVPTRSKGQIMTHYHHHIAKHLDEKSWDEMLSSPTYQRKRKNAEDEVASAKKSKGGEKVAGTSATKKAATTPAKVRVMQTSPRPTPKSSASKKTPSSKGVDLIPSGGKSKKVSPPKRSPAKKQTSKPEKVDPVTKDSSSGMELEETSSSTSQAVIQFLRREEVQTIAAGLVGFLVVFAVKRFVGVN